MLPLSEATRYLHRLDIPTDTIQEEMDGSHLDGNVHDWQTVESHSVNGLMPNLLTLGANQIQFLR